MKKQITRNDLAILLTDLACSISANVNATDDDMQETWDYVKTDYERVKNAMDAYIAQGEK